MTVFRSNNEMKEVFVFGAGASNGSAHTPLGNELVWTYHEQCCPHRAIGIKGLIEEFKEFANLSKFFNLVEQTYPELIGIKKTMGKCR